MAIERSAPPVARRFFEFSLLGMLASGYFAVLGSGQLDFPTAAVMFGALAARAFLVAGSWELLLPAKVVAGLSLLYLGFFPLDYFVLSGEFLPALTHMIFFIAVVKLLSASTPRDYMYLKVIATLELLAAALLSTHISFFFFLATFLLCAVGTFASGEIVRAATASGAAGASRPQRLSRNGIEYFPRRLTVLTSGLFLGILVITGGMFFVLPRTARAALQRFVPQRYHLPGFSNEITLGEIGEIKQSNASVMHVRSYDGEGLLAVRWRASALQSFDGTRWFNPPEQEQRIRVRDGEVILDPLPENREGRSLRYEVQLDEIAPDTLLFAGTPETIRIATSMLWRSAGGALRAPRIRLDGLRYSAQSFLENEYGPVRGALFPLSTGERSVLLSLPPIDTRIYELAQDWTQGFTSPMEKARAMENHLRSEYGYTLELLPESVGDPLAHFLFERRSGHCEYFASALAVMLRTIGIPARVATGFLSGVYNPMTGWQVVRAADAHSWVEAWIDGRGWVTLDPTPPDPNGGGGLRFTRLSMMLDAAEQFWRDWVMGYDFEHQVVLASRMQSAGRGLKFAIPEAWTSWAPTVSGVSVGLLTIVVGFAGFLAGVILLTPRLAKWVQARNQLRRARSGKAQAHDATVLYQRMLHVLERRGFTKPAWLTPDEFARVFPAQSELALLVEDMTGAYNQVRFGGRQDAAPRMVRLLERIESHSGR